MAFSGDGFVFLDSHGIHALMCMGWFEHAWKAIVVGFYVGGYVGLGLISLHFRDIVFWEHSRDRIPVWLTKGANVGSHMISRLRWTDCHCGVRNVVGTV